MNARTLVATSLACTLAGACTDPPAEGVPSDLGLDAVDAVDVENTYDWLVPDTEGCAPNGAIPGGGCCPEGHVWEPPDRFPGPIASSDVWVSPEVACVPVGPAGCEEHVFNDASQCVPRYCASWQSSGQPCDPADGELLCRLVPGACECPEPGPCPAPPFECPTGSYPGGPDGGCIPAGLPGDPRDPKDPLGPLPALTTPIWCEDPADDSTCCPAGAWKPESSATCEWAGLAVGGEAPTATTMPPLQPAGEPRWCISELSGILARACTPAEHLAGEGCAPGEWPRDVGCAPAGSAAPADCTELNPPELTIATSADLASELAAADKGVLVGLDPGVHDATDLTITGERELQGACLADTTIASDVTISGSTSLREVTITGDVTVEPGASLWLERVRVEGAITVSQAIVWIRDAEIADVTLSDNAEAIIQGVRASHVSVSGANTTAEIVGLASEDPAGPVVHATSGGSATIGACAIEAVVPALRADGAGSALEIDHTVVAAEVASGRETSAAVLATAEGRVAVTGSLVSSLDGVGVDAKGVGSLAEARGTRFSKSLTALTTESAGEVRASGSYVDGSVQTGADVIGAARLEGLLVTGAAAGVNVQDGQLTMRDSRVTEVELGGIQISKSDALLVGVLVDDVSSPAGVALGLTECRFTVRGSRFSGANGHGVVVQGPSESVSSFEGVLFDGAGDAEGGISALGLVGSTSSLRLRGCRVSGNAGGGVLVTNSVSNVGPGAVIVTGTTIDGNGALSAADEYGFGIRLVGSSENALEASLVSGNFGIGAILAGAQTTTVEHTVVAATAPATYNAGGALPTFGDGLVVVTRDSTQQAGDTVTASRLLLTGSARAGFVLERPDPSIPAVLRRSVLRDGGFGAVVPEEPMSLQSNVYLDNDTDIDVNVPPFAIPPPYGSQP